jgi:Fungal N-terminal domain of STAND proteins
MDGLSAAASGIAVVSLALQLIQITQSLRAFINDVSGAPREIQRLALSLAQLANILKDVQYITEIQHDQEGAPPPPSSLLASLETCKEQLLQLQSILMLVEEKLRCSGRVSRQWESFKVVFKKRDIEIFGKNLDQAIQYLSVAMTMNLIVLKYVSPFIYFCHH